MSELTKARFTGGRINAAMDADDVTAVRTEVHFSRTIEHRYQEHIEVSLVFFDPELSIGEIEKQSFHRAEEFILELADAIRAERGA